jgi:tRNA A37 methylthiotransferase MiaB
MGRHWYTAREYGRAVERLAATLPVFGLGADVIAGFLGDTRTTRRRSRWEAALPFTYLHVFPFVATGRRPSGWDATSPAASCSSVPGRCGTSRSRRRAPIGGGVPGRWPISSWWGTTSGRG